MNIEFHYYITYILAYESGFSEDESYKIAYSSQYTDDNNKIALIKRKNGEEYKSYISQTMNIFKPINKLVRIYSCFHFFPGDYSCENAKRKDGSLHILNTIPCSENAQKMFDKALSSKNPYRIGIATHAFADTWAHQNFIGYKHSFGVLRNNFLIPNIGHAEAHVNPDVPNLIWTDKRLVSSNEKVNNKERFIEACEVIFRKFCEYNSTEFETKWHSLKPKLDNAIGEPKKSKCRCEMESEQRIKAYKKICPFIPKYSSIDWIKSACEIDIKEESNGLFAEFYPIIWEGIRLKLRQIITKCGISIKAKEAKGVKLIGEAKDGFCHSDWYNFQEAVKAHQDCCIDILKDNYEQMEIDEEIF